MSYITDSKQQLSSVLQNMTVPPAGAGAPFYTSTHDMLTTPAFSGQIPIHTNRGGYIIKHNANGAMAYNVSNGHVVMGSYPGAKFHPAQDLTK